MNSCDECKAEGAFGVALRECQTCGHIGFSVSSTDKYATRHFQQTQHPVMREVRLAEWAWCYVHEVLDMLG